jgi:UDP-glucose 4-epimerase
MKILITGGAGFIGTNLIPKLLDAGHEVVVIDNMSHGTYVPAIHDRVKFHKADCCVREAVFSIVRDFMPDATFMFHGLVSIYDCHRDPQKAISNNLIGSSNLFDALIANKCPRVIFAETSAVYENNPLPIDGYSEETSDPTTMYAVTKAALVLMARSYARTRGLKFTALRYFNVAGAMQDFRRTVPPLFAGFALRMIGGNDPIIFGDGCRRRDFIHVDDINEFHLQCLTDDRTINETFNLGRGESHSLYEIGFMVAKILNESGLKKKIDLSDIRYSRLPEINGEAFEIRANISKAKALGWIPKKTIYTALLDTIQYLKAEIEKGNIDPKTFMNDVKITDVKIG